MECDYHDWCAAVLFQLGGLGMGGGKCGEREASGWVAVAFGVMLFRGVLRLVLARPRCISAWDALARVCLQLNRQRLPSTAVLTPAVPDPLCLQHAPLGPGPPDDG